MRLFETCAPQFWSARVGLHYRALAVQSGEELGWFWIARAAASASAMLLEAQVMSHSASSQSNEEFFQAVRDLMASLEAGGHPEAAAELREGFGYLNGLTDGWALFLDSIEKVQAAHSERFGQTDQQALDAIRKAARSAVYRR